MVGVVVVVVVVVVMVVVLFCVSDQNIGRQCCHKPLLVSSVRVADKTPALDQPVLSTLAGPRNPDHRTTCWRHC